MLIVRRVCHDPSSTILFTWATARTHGYLPVATQTAILCTNRITDTGAHRQYHLAILTSSALLSRDPEAKCGGVGLHIPPTSETSLTWGLQEAESHLGTPIHGENEGVFDGRTAPADAIAPLPLWCRQQQAVQLDVDVAWRVLHGIPSPRMDHPLAATLGDLLIP